MDSATREEIRAWLHRAVDELCDRVAKFDVPLRASERLELCPEQLAFNLAGGDVNSLTDEQLLDWSKRRRYTLKVMYDGLEEATSDVSPDAPR